MINRPDLQTSTNPSPIQTQSSSHRFTSKSEQNTTTYHSHWNPREKVVLVLFMAQCTLVKVA